MSDFRTALMRGDDARFIAELRGPALPRGESQDHGADLARLRADVVDMRDKLHASQASAALIKHFDQRLTEVDSTLHALQTDQPLAKRMAVYLAMNTLLPALPLAVPVRSHQNQFVAELAGLYAKTTLMAVGSIRSPTAANKHSLGDHFMSRHYINVMQSMIFALPTFVGKLNHVNDHPAFSVGAGAISTFALFGGFFGNEIRAFVNTRRHGSPNPDLAAARPLSSPAQQALAAVMDLAQSGRDALLGARDRFIQDGRHELSPYTGKQVTLAADAYLAMARDLAEALGLSNEDRRENHDFLAKVALAVFTATVCATTTALMYPDKIGMVDLGSDAIFTAALMLKHATNPNVTRGDALEEFKSFAGLSLVMLAVLAANHAAGQFIEKGHTGLLVGSLTMAALNMTIPGPVGNAAGAGLEKLMNRMMNMRPGPLLETLKAIGHNALQIFQRRGPDQPDQPRATLVELDAAVQPNVEGSNPPTNTPSHL